MDKLFSKKSKLPANWPSPFHNKCSKPECNYANPPQPAKGTYLCTGIPGGFYCEGTYKVSSAMARDADQFFREQNQLLVDEQKRLAKRNMLYINPTGADQQKKTTSGGQGGLERRTAIRKPPPPPGVQAVHHPRAQIRLDAVERRKAQEYYADQRTKEMYPDYNVRQRWI